ncbi:3-oxoacyl-[acyl-carrier-protein] reductase FabG-like protein [Dinothrombium tinctorium]|uniref:3-oxoacyl-[acyl-carrier-protein] reductase FabG-like protein n=1 Tax=Dinothrombium tinctorium TaxID=1965070 RepID=A0A3S3P2B2_9ACAR|nr:3-oxoacyl-[acyl-carrier-protein] reductase FabG-like protein [Dinothrombium tinctorium]RWS06555.1 3-oxoacyl-[acyl-carrier-protein] reductase FabG-like protein [Dinothrombium tinctorium]
MNGKVVLITGSSSGTGAVTAQEFAKLGAKLVITGRNAQGIRSTADACEKLSPNVICDLEKDEDIRKLVNCTIDYYEKLDLLICFHGIGKMTSYDMPNLIELHDSIMKVNLRAIVYLCHLTIPHLVKRRGSIIIMSSIGAEKPYDQDMVGCMANAAVDLFVRYLAVRLGPEDKASFLNGVNLKVDGGYSLVIVPAITDK